jgi:membrane-bound ClpP family serine protease
VFYLAIGLLVILLLRQFRSSSISRHAGFEDLTGVVGLFGKAEETFTTEGTVMVRGEIWKATSKKGIVRKGDRVRVVRVVTGLLLEVELDPEEQ